MRGFKNHQNKLGIFLLAVGLLAGCGSNEQASAPAAVASTPAVRWAANVSPGTTLGVELFTRKGVDLSTHCIQLAEHVADPSRREIRLSNTACPGDRLAGATFASYDIHEYVDPDNIATPTNLFILYYQFLPVGWMEAVPGGYSLKDLCTIEDMFRSSCSLNFRDRQVVGVTLNAAAPQARLTREIKLLQEAQDLRSSLANSKAKLAETITALGESQRIASEQKKAVGLVLLAQQSQLEQLIKISGASLEGQGTTKGYNARLVDARKSVQDLLVQLEARAKELKPLEDEITSLRARIKILRTQSDELSLKRIGLAGAELEKVLLELGRLTGTIFDAEDELRIRINKREDSEVYHADVRDRQAFEKLKRTAGVLSPLIELTLEVMSKARTGLKQRENAITLLRDNKVPQAVEMLPSLCEDLEKINGSLERIQALVLQLRMD